MEPATDRTRRRLAAAALVAGAAGIGISLVFKDVNGTDARELLETVAAHPGRFEASSLAQLIGAALLVPGTVGLLRLLPGRGARLGLIAVALLVVNAFGNIGDAALAPVLSQAAAHGITPSEVALVDGVQTSALSSLVESMVLVGLLGFPLLAIALRRARTVPAAAPALIGASFVAFFVPGAGELIGGVLLTAAMAIVAVTLGRDEAPRAARASVAAVPA
jgi:hypothetical protein